MNIRDICEQALGLCVEQFKEIEAAVPPAQWTPWEDSFNWVFTERLPSQILVQKLARYITGLRALDVLIKSGLLQEVGVIFRMLDEIEQDIAFISLGLTTQKWTKYHDLYADFFWSDDENMPPVQRKNIRAFVNRALDQPDPSTADRVSKTIHTTYSDYVHARSAPIMGMVVGPPARIEVNGIHDPRARYPYIEQAPSYFYRGLISASFAAKPILSGQRSSYCFEQLKAFEKLHADKLF